LGGWLLGNALSYDPLKEATEKELREGVSNYEDEDGVRLLHGTTWNSAVALVDRNEEPSLIYETLTSPAPGFSATPDTEAGWKVATKWAHTKADLHSDDAAIIRFWVAKHFLQDNAVFEPDLPEWLFPVDYRNNPLAGFDALRRNWKHFRKEWIPAF